MKEQEKIEAAITRLLNTKDGAVLLGELEYYVTMPLHSDSPYDTAYNCGKRDMAIYLLRLAETGGRYERTG